MEANLKCSSTGENVANVAGSVSFKCPNCLDNLIVRSKYARVIAAPYKCAKCGFDGPN